MMVPGALLKPDRIPKLDKLRRAASDYPCQLCGRPKEHTVPAHNNDVEWKGIGKKSPGFLIAYVCGFCHDEMDGRSGGLPKEEKRDMWDRAFKRTVAIWFRDGLVTVC